MADSNYLQVLMSGPSAGSIGASEASDILAKQRQQQITLALQNLVGNFTQGAGQAATDYRKNLMLSRIQKPTDTAQQALTASLQPKQDTDTTDADPSYDPTQDPAVQLQKQQADQEAAQNAKIQQAQDLVASNPNAYVDSTGNAWDSWQQYDDAKKQKYSTDYRAQKESEIKLAQNAAMADLATQRAQAMNAGLTKDQIDSIDATGDTSPAQMLINQLAVQGAKGGAVGEQAIANANKIASFLQANERAGGMGKEYEKYAHQGIDEDLQHMLANKLYIDPADTPYDPRMADSAVDQYMTANLPQMASITAASPEMGKFLMEEQKRYQGGENAALTAQQTQDRAYQKLMGGSIDRSQSLNAQAQSLAMKRMELDAKMKEGGMNRAAKDNLAAQKNALDWRIATLRSATGISQSNIGASSRILTGSLQSGAAYVPEQQAYVGTVLQPFAYTGQPQAPVSTSDPTKWGDSFAPNPYLHYVSEETKGILGTGIGKKSIGKLEAGNSGPGGAPAGGNANNLTGKKKDPLGLGL